MNDTEPKEYIITIGFDDETINTIKEHNSDPTTINLNVGTIIIEKINEELIKKGCDFQI